MIKFVHFQSAKAACVLKMYLPDSENRENQLINVYSYGQILQQPAGIQSVLHQGKKRIKGKKTLLLGAFVLRKKKLYSKNKFITGKRRKRYTKAEGKCHSTAIY